jgi:hypothetical protein
MIILWCVLFYGVFLWWASISADRKSQKGKRSNTVCLFGVGGGSAAAVAADEEEEEKKQEEEEEEKKKSPPPFFFF